VTPVEVVDKQLEAFNERNLDSFLATYAEDARVHDLQNGRPSLVGRPAISEVYSKAFQNQGLRAEILARLAVGNKVIDHERGWGIGSGPTDFVAVYEVEGDFIRNAWLLRTNESSVKTLVQVSTPSAANEA
jgi:hypothetical protein